MVSDGEIGRRWHVGITRLWVPCLTHLNSEEAGEEIGRLMAHDGGTLLCWCPFDLYARARSVL